jgi:hypothetical protein
LAESGAGTPLILFGACDRHNFGDLLFPHIAAALQPNREIIVAGLAARDLTCHGGHRVAALADLETQWGDSSVEILHVGGEILSCDAWLAAVMLQTPAAARAAIARYDRHPEARLAWAYARLGRDDFAPYVLSRRHWPRATRITFQAVGGVTLDACDAALRVEVLARLAAADAVSVRDHCTQAHLVAAGIRADLAPDPVTRVADLFGGCIAQRMAAGEVAEVRHAFPQGFLAVQFSADFGDDATLAAIVAGLERVTAATGCGIVLFRAGAAPWHDDSEVYRRAAARMRAGTVRLFASLDIWDICALIAAGRGYCGSSLHGRIVAAAYALPRIGLVHADQPGRTGKQAAYAATWEPEGRRAVVPPAGIAAALLAALA